MSLQCVLFIVFVFSRIIYGQDTHKLIAEYVPEGRSYTMVYHFRNPAGLVRIVTASCWPHTIVKNYPTTVTIDRSAENRVKIKAILTRSLVGDCDTSAESFVGRHMPGEDQRPWRPWHDDSAQGVHGGNRLKISLEYPGEYSITVPADADIDAKLTSGCLSYVVSQESNGTTKRKYDSFVDKGTPSTKLKTPHEYLKIIAPVAQSDRAAGS